MELLDKAKAVTGSDSETARRLGMKQGHISDVRNGRRKLSAYQAGQIADILQERWYDHALPILADNAKSVKERQYWMGKLEMLGKIVAPAALVASLALIPARGVEASTLPANPTGDGAMYIMLRNNLTNP